jgi:outer membrane biosynthesis protein TonB
MFAAWLVDSFVAEDDRAMASPIDPQLLTKVLADNMPLVTNMGEYETISRPMAAKGSGLVAMAPLIESIVDMQPSAELPLAQLKTALLQLVLGHPAWNSTRYRNDHYAGMRTERLMTLLHHVRRVVREPRRRAQLNLKLSGKEATRLDSIFAKVTLRQNLAVGEEAGVQDQDSPMDGDDLIEAAGAEDSPMDDEMIDACAGGAPKTTRATMELESEFAPEDPELSKSKSVENKEISKATPRKHKDTSKKQKDTSKKQTPEKDTKKQKDTSKKQKDTPRKQKDPPKKQTPEKKTPEKQKDTPKKQTPEKDTSLKYIVMYYKQNNSFGVRQSGGGKQVLSVCKKGLAKDVLSDLAHKAKRSLEMGDDPLETRIVVKHKLVEMAKDLESEA